MSKFIEKIAYVEINHDDKDNTPFALFYGTNTFPTEFPLNVTINFMNLVPDKEYILETTIIRDYTPIAQYNKQDFSIPKESMVLINDGYGQAFIQTGILYKIFRSGTYKFNFKLKHQGSVLDEFSIYSFIGG